jgi:acyl-CoA thioesterase FadM
VTAELQLRYIAACFYDEPLRVYSKLVSFGRSSAVMDQAMVGTDTSIRALSRVAIVRSTDAGIAPWSDAQRAAIDRFCGPLPASTNADA